MSSREFIFEKKPQLMGNHFNVSGRIVRHYQCKNIKRHCLLEEGLFYNNMDEELSIERQIKILSDILSKSEYETSRTCYYSKEFNQNEPTSQDYEFVEVDSIRLPQNHFEKIDSALMNVYHIFGDRTIQFTEPLEFMSIYARDSDEVDAMISSLVDFGYLSLNEDGVSSVISKEGWKHIYDIERMETDRTGFIAIEFSEKTEKIIETLKKGIEKAGFNPIVIKDVEHNNQIVPEIRKYIERCSFLVMDCTCPNLGAYYEAGIAVGQGKEVIICCREDSFKSSESRPHFDIAQQSMIIWKDPTDLVERLAKRIEATIGTKSKWY